MDPAGVRHRHVPFKRRGRGLEEFIAAMRAAWGPDPVTFEGRFYRIPPSEIKPKPVQQEGIPILLGVLAPPAIERAARVADGLNPIAFSFEALQGMVNRFRAAARAAGRDPASLKVMVRANTPITDAAMMADRPFLGGSPEQVACDLQRVQELDVDHVLFTNLIQPPLDDQVRLLDRLQQAVA
jgi:alkanesulfonate monooxygenase SsuD/methylene tetrahydromethanopterin reductase-like flavin-dependent oxidoreductase (luciferase family)